MGREAVSQADAGTDLVTVEANYRLELRVRSVGDRAKEAISTVQFGLNRPDILDAFEDLATHPLALSDDQDIIHIPLLTETEYEERSQMTIVFFLQIEEDIDLGTIEKLDNILRVRKAASGYGTDGSWIAGVPDSVMLEGVVHPITGGTNLSERMIQEIDNNRDRKWVVIYSPPTDQEVVPEVSWRTSSESGQFEADIMVYNGERYEIAMIDEWEAGVLDHIKAIAKRLDLRDVD